MNETVGLARRLYNAGNVWLLLSAAFLVGWPQSSAGQVTGRCTPKCANSSGLLYCGNVLSGGAPTGALQWLARGAHSLGVVVAANACYPADQPMDAASIANARTNLQATISTMGWLQGCLGFDTRPLQRLSDNLDNMTGTAVSRQAGTIAQSLARAVAQAQTRCEGLNGGFEAIYTAAYNLGMAGANAVTCVWCTAQVNAALLRTINGQVTTAFNALNRAGWFNRPGFTSGNFTTTVSGASGLYAYAGTIQNWEALTVALANSDTCCTCKPKQLQAAEPAAPTTSDCNPACQEYCRSRGARDGWLRSDKLHVCMLGVVSGGVGSAVCECR